MRTVRKESTELVQLQYVIVLVGAWKIKVDNLVVELEDGEGILYEIIDDLVNPLRMIKTLSKDEIKEYK